MKSKENLYFTSGSLDPKLPHGLVTVNKDHPHILLKEENGKTYIKVEKNGDPICPFTYDAKHEMRFIEVDSAVYRLYEHYITTERDYILRQVQRRIFG